MSEADVCLLFSVISFFAGILLGVLIYDTLKKVDELNKEEEE